MTRYITVDHAVLPTLAELHGMAISVYVAIKSFADRNGECFPEHESIAALAGVSLKTVQRLVPRMVERGLLVQRRRNTKGGRTSNVYVFPKVRQTDGLAAQRTVSPEPTVPQSTANGLTDGGTNSTELTPPNKPSTDGDGCPKTRHKYTPEFELWWSHYPRLRRTDKLDCSRKYATAAARVGHQVLLDAVIAYAASDQGRGQYSPEPARWLARGRYEDDPATWQDRNGKARSARDELEGIPDLAKRRAAQ